MTTQADVTPVDPVRYFRSFVSYQIPFVPDEEISFAETEGMQSYYVGKYEGEQLVRFTKIELVRRRADNILLPSPRAPGTRIYFQAARTHIGSVTKVGEVISFADTKHTHDYFEGVVDTDWQHCSVDLFCRRRAFLEVYEYWKNGLLKLRKQYVRGHKGRIWEFNSDGQFVKPTDTSSPDVPANGKRPEPEKRVFT